MKIGFRKPSIKKSIKARTTGKIKRKVKKAVNPFYGKKGMGYINDPKKAVYNKVYNKTTFGTTDVINAATKTNSKNSNSTKQYSVNTENPVEKKGCKQCNGNYFAYYLFSCGIVFNVG